ncbi:hypothetical protein C0993_007902 [Termitomyces sp. T159_Od127]|nr:hypothetical protein C0993_007902 [Termitomyces sp. T159_Od127]
MSPPPTSPPPASAPAPAPAPAPPAAPASPTAAKRKPSRRANTAERRATHNAVERQRRETLNGRFLDLAALLPNLSQIRRPSKSSIVNSSIAHINASRRHRILASRELRLLKLEADALRRELNEWRERAGIPRIEEPVRGEGFSMIISAELEVIVGVPGPNDPDDDDEEPLSAGGNPTYGGYVGGDGSLPDDDYMDIVSPTNHGPSPTAPSHSASPGAPLDDPRMLALLKHHQNPFAPSAQPGLPHILPRPGTANGPTNVPAFDAMYEHYPQQGLPHHAQIIQQQQQQHAAYLHQQQQHAMRERDHQREREREMHLRERMQQEKMWSMYGGDPSRSSGGGSAGGARSFPGQWGPQGKQQHQMMMHAQRSLFTPPATSHGLPTPSPTGSGDAHSAGSPASSDTGDESAGQRARSGSRSSRGSHSPSYELGVGVGMHGHGQAGVPRMGGMLGMEMGLLGVGVGVEMH